MGEAYFHFYTNQSLGSLYLPYLCLSVERLKLRISVIRDPVQQVFYVDLCFLCILMEETSIHSQSD